MTNETRDRLGALAFYATVIAGTGASAYYGYRVWETVLGPRSYGVIGGAIGGAVGLIPSMLVGYVAASVVGRP